MESPKNKSILISTCFNEPCSYAMNSAATMATKTQGKLIILHVIDSDTKKMLKNENKEESYVMEKLSSMAQHIGTQFGVDAVPVVKEGDLFEALNQVCEAHDVLFHYIGSSGRKSALSGSFTMKMVRRAKVPSFVYQEKPEHPEVKNIIYPLDLHPGSKQKVNWVIKLNQLTDIHLDIIVDGFSDEVLVRKLKATLKQLTDILDYHQIPYTECTADYKKSFEKQIVELALEKQADAIMVTCDPDKVSWGLIQSVEEKVLYNKAHFPVLFINAKSLGIVSGAM